MGDHIGIMLFIEIENLEFPGGHIEVMLFIEIDNNISISINSIKKNMVTGESNF